MAGKKAPGGKKTTDKKAGGHPSTDLARRIWLAGVGAYDQAQGAAGKLASGAGETFQQLVARGEVAEEALRARINAAQPKDKLVKAMETFASRAQKIGEDQAAALQEGFGKVRRSVGESLAPLNVSALAQSVEKLTAQVEALSAEVKAMKATPKPAPKPAAPRKAPPRAKPQA